MKPLFTVNYGTRKVGKLRNSSGLKIALEAQTLIKFGFVDMPPYPKLSEIQSTFASLKGYSKVMAFPVSDALRSQWMSTIANHWMCRCLSGSIWGSLWCSIKATEEAVCIGDFRCKRYSKGLVWNFVLGKDGHLVCCQFETLCAPELFRQSIVLIITNVFFSRNLNTIKENICSGKGGAILNTFCAAEKNKGYSDNLGKCTSPDCKLVWLRQ